MAVDYSRDDLEMSFAEISFAEIGVAETGQAPEACSQGLRRTESIQTGGKECNRADQND